MSLRISTMARTRTVGTMSGIRWRLVARLSLAAIAGLVSLLSVAPAKSEARTPPRQIASDKLTTKAPGTPQGDKLSIDLVGPGGPSAKPFSLESFVLTFSRGTLIDTSVPEQCRATDAELIAVGPAACPDGSRIGHGKTEVDTGLLSSALFPRILKLDLSIFNNAHQVLNVTETTNTPVPIRTIVRNPIDGASVRTAVPPIPGAPPPDPFIALRSIRVTIEPVVREGRAYRLSPPKCPSSGTWKTRLAFFYRDGVSETTETQSPCEPASRGCVGGPATIWGTPGSDTLTGTAAGDQIAGLGGSDEISGGPGKDVICGGSGKDTVRGNLGNDTLHGGGGGDKLLGGPGPDICRGGRGRDRAQSCEKVRSVP